MRIIQNIAAGTLLAACFLSGASFNGLAIWERSDICYGFPIRVEYDPTVSKVLNEQKFDEKVMVAIEYRILETKLARDSNETVVIAFNEGPSVDPVFTIYRKQADGTLEPYAYFGGCTLVVPGNGTVYTSGRVNNWFDVRQKFEFTEAGKRTVKQPFNYVGMKTETLRPITLYLEPGSTEAVEQVPERAEIEILLNKPDTSDYLIRTAFGIVGWFHQDMEDIGGTGGFPGSRDIKGLCFMGD